MKASAKTTEVYVLEQVIDPEGNGGATTSVRLAFNTRKGTFKIGGSIPTKCVSYDNEEQNKGLVKNFSAMVWDAITKANELRTEWHESNPDSDPDQLDLFKAKDENVIVESEPTKRKRKALAAPVEATGDGFGDPLNLGGENG